MATLITFGIKDKDGVWRNYTASLDDNTNEWGKNVNIWLEQSKEQRERKENRTFVGSGKVVWTDGKVTKAEQKQPISQEADDDLPF